MIEKISYIIIFELGKYNDGKPLRKHLQKLRARKITRNCYLLKKNIGTHKLGEELFHHLGYSGDHLFIFPVNQFYFGRTSSLQLSRWMEKNFPFRLKDAFK
jgi:hypothetical protein